MSLKRINSRSCPTRRPNYAIVCCRYRSVSLSLLSLIRMLPIYQCSLPFLCFWCPHTHVMLCNAQAAQKHLTGKTAQLITNQCNTSVGERRVCQNVNKSAKPLFAVDRRLLSVRGGLAISQIETKWSRLMTATTATTAHE